MGVIIIIGAVILICAGMLLRGKAWQSFIDNVTEKEDEKKQDEEK